MKVLYIITSTQGRVVVYMYHFEIICLKLIMVFAYSLSRLIIKDMISYVTLLSSDS